MKEKIKQLAGENFRYQASEIILSKEKLQITVESGKSYMNCLEIEDAEGKEMKGVVSCNMAHMQITNPMFRGIHNKIQYIFDAKYIKSEHSHALPKKYMGQLCLITSLGERCIPVEVTVVEPFVQTSIGETKDLFHFANLAATNWNEAADLFASDEFERVFLKTPEYKGLYRSLYLGKDKHLSMEEFLISIQKKLPLHITLSDETRTYSEKAEDFCDKIVISKDSWGYERFRIYTEAPFLSLAKNDFSTFDFVGNQYEAEFFIIQEKLRHGKNIGKICVESTHKTWEIPVCVETINDYERLNKHRKEKELMLKITQNYLNLRTNQIAHDKYIADLAEILKESKDCFDEWKQTFMEFHYYMIDHQAAAEDVSKFLYLNAGKLKGDNSLYYAAYLYLQALYSKDYKDIDFAVSEIRSLYNENPLEWRYLWFLLYLDETYDEEPEKRFLALEECLDLGTNSPVIYFEACSCLLKDKKSKPYFLKYLLTLLQWGIRMEYLDEELQSLFCFLAQQQEPTKPVLNTLERMYEKDGNKEALSSLCQLLLKKESYDERDFKWFDEGQKRQLKIKHLFEAYVETMEENYSVRIPNHILTFFQYDNCLSDRRKAFLYAYILKNRNRDMGIFNVYENTIWEFAIQQIRRGVMDRHHAVIYKEFIDPMQLSDDLLTAVSRIMFRYEIRCNTPNMKGVWIRHKEINQEKYVALNNGMAYADICTENPILVFEDKKGNRFSGSVEFEYKRLLHIHKLAGQCYQVCHSNVMLQLYLFEKADKYQKINETAISVQSRCILLNDFEDIYKERCYERLMEYYFDKMEGDALVDLLRIADFSILGSKLRAKAIYYALIYDLKDKAEAAMREYGFSHVPLNRLIRFASEALEKNGLEVKNRFLLELSIYIYEQGKYNEIILSYLLQHYEGSLEQLKELWNCCVNFELDALQIEERIISQALFCEHSITDMQEIFTSFYHKCGDCQLTRAFTAYASFQYLMDKMQIGETLFRIIEKEGYQEKLKACKLALLFFYSKKKELQEEEKKWCEKTIHELSKEDFCLPFFQKFRGKIELPSKLLNYYYVAYICNPKNRVTIHYSMGDKQSQLDYKTAVMENVYYGIHVIRFLRFCDESLQYYISENDGETEQITESVSVDFIGDFATEDESDYGLLNLILTANELKDEKTVLEAMTYYAERKYAVEKLIRVL